MKRISAVLLIFALFFAAMAGPLSGTAAAATLRFTLRFTPTGGWQLVASPASSQSAFRATYARYRVQAGDTLLRISRLFNATVEELQQLNRLANDRLLSGQLLLIPLTGSLRPAPALRQQPVTPPAAPVTVVPPPAPAQGTGSVLAENEQRMLDLVNRDRTVNGLRPLLADPELTRLARLKSQDMITLNYFAHHSPTYGSPFEMMRAAGVTFRIAGENLAGAGTVTAAHTALMNSPGHRANILNPAYTHIGIGTGVSGRFGLVFTQLFVGR
ncbi:MAG: hypothetical protein DDT21_00618 [Syntrophomonadaceae bacterium]|nr:hypothetical protein [Bacillota bacterium]